MKILFSPVGMTDPVSPDKPKGKGTYHEGALLQICRHYKPDLVYIYMSKESCELEKEDHRYLHGLDLLKNDTGQTFEVKTIERSDLVDVHIFDYFLDEYKMLLKEIRDKHPDDEIFVNVSSGTPAMKSALQILAAATDLNLKPLQVSTANRSANNPRECSIETEWKTNLDTSPESPSRVEESSNKNLLFEFNKKLLISLINNYDYHGARLLAESMHVFLTVETRELLNAAVLRYDLKTEDAKKLFDKCGHSDLMKNKDVASEYFMLLELKVRKKEYLDFLRGVTPLILEVFYNMAKKELKTDLTEYTDHPRNKYNWNIGKLRNSVLDGMFDQKSQYHKNPRPMKGGTYPVNYVLSWHISNLAENLSNDSKLVRRTIKIREFEEEVRNLAAHTMTSFTKDEIKTKTGWTPEDMIKELYDYIMNYTSIPVDSSTLTVYDELNKKLIKLIG